MRVASADVLLKACRATGPLELRVGSVVMGFTHWVLNQPFALLGSHPIADVLLESEAVSPRHAYLQVIGGHVFGVNLDGRRATRWPNGTGDAAWLSVHESLGAGLVNVEIVRGGRPIETMPAADPLAEGSGREFQLPEATLKLSHPGFRHPPWRMNRCLAFVGRAKVCKLRLFHPSISGVHCSLVGTRNGLMVVDLCSRKGIKVNQARARVALLEEGDELQIGALPFRVSYGESANRTSQVQPASPPSYVEGPFDPMPAPDAQHQQLDPTAVLSPILSQFTSMQQQMLDQFQQSLRSMMQPDGAVPTQPIQGDARPPATPEQFQRQIEEQFKDERYQQAFMILALNAGGELASAAPDGSASVDGARGFALEYLVGQGIPRAEAEQNLAVMLKMLSAQ